MVQNNMFDAMMVELDYRKLPRQGSEVEFKG